MTEKRTKTTRLQDERDEIHSVQMFLNVQLKHILSVWFRGEKRKLKGHSKTRKVSFPVLRTVVCFALIWCEDETLPICGLQWSCLGLCPQRNLTGWICLLAWIKVIKWSFRECLCEWWLFHECLLSFHCFWINFPLTWHRQWSRLDGRAWDGHLSTSWVGLEVLFSFLNSAGGTCTFFFTLWGVSKPHWLENTKTRHTSFFSS